MSSIEEILAKHLPQEQIVFDNGTSLSFPVQKDNTLTFKGLTRRGKEFESLSLDLKEIKEFRQMLYKAARTAMDDLAPEWWYVSLGKYEPLLGNYEKIIIEVQCRWETNRRTTYISFQGPQGGLIHDVRVTDLYQLIELADKLEYQLRAANMEEVL